MPPPSLRQSLSQLQTITPQMQRSLEILQTSSMELAQVVEQALATNPVLEDVTETTSLDVVRNENAPPDETLEPDYEEHTWTSADQAKREFFQQSLIAPESLHEHLAAQLRTTILPPALRTAAQALLGNINDRGFFDLPPAQFAQEMNLPLAEVAAAAEVIRSFDPPGIGAIDLKDSLLLQLTRSGSASSVEARIVEKHLDDLAHKHFELIARALGVNVPRVLQAAETIAHLNPNPGGGFDPLENPVIRPDVVIQHSKEGWEARLTNEYIPRLRISDFYKDLLGKTAADPQASQYLREHLRQGRELLQALSLRQETILQLAELLLARQRDFFDHGPGHLRPLTMAQLAEDLGVHPSTISRAVAGKYILTPHGLMEMRHFFTAGYHTDKGENISNSAVRDTVHDLIATEDPAAPLSDQAIREKLQARGISVARRTVAKYRDQLGILPSRLRRTR